MGIVHHGESEPHLSRSPAPAPTYTLSHKCTEIWQANCQQFLPFLFFSPLFWVFVLALALGRRLFLQLEPDQAALARLWLAGLAPGEPARPGRTGHAVCICSMAAANTTSEAGEGNLAHVLAGWLVLGRAHRLSPLFIQQCWAGYKRLPVKISFGTSIPERAFAKEKYCQQALGKHNSSGENN